MTLSVARREPEILQDDKVKNMLSQRYFGASLSDLFDSFDFEEAVYSSSTWHVERRYIHNCFVLQSCLLLSTASSLHTLKFRVSIIKKLSDGKDPTHKFSIAYYVFAFGSPELLQRLQNSNVPARLTCLLTCSLPHSLPP